MNGLLGLRAPITLQNIALHSPPPPYSSPRVQSYSPPLPPSPSLSLLLNSSSTLSSFPPTQISPSLPSRGGERQVQEVMVPAWQVLKRPGQAGTTSAPQQALKRNNLPLHIAKRAPSTHTHTNKHKNTQERGGD